MKKFRLLSLFLFVVIIGTQSCNYNKSTLPHSTGKTLELIVVTNNKEQWNSRIGSTIKEFFGQKFVGLPNFEPMFDILPLPQEAFIDMYKPNHLIFIVDINKKFKTPIIETKKNLWSIPQRVIKISAADANSFIKAFNERKEGIIKLFQEVSRERILNYFKSSEASKVKSILKKSLKLDLILPSGFSISKHIANNFIWLKKEKRRSSLGLIIYTSEYSDKNVFELKNIIRRRNAYTKLYVPGPTKGSYMKVYEDGIDIVSKEINFKGMYAVETRGMWEVKNDFMAGSFLNYTFIDEKRNRVITIDSYIYAPNTEKRIRMKELEAILYSVKFVSNQEKK
jgi:hypothetical protein